jgi:hypothetical protein
MMWEAIAVASIYMSVILGPLLAFGVFVEVIVPAILRRRARRARYGKGAR